MNRCSFGIEHVNGSDTVLRVINCGGIVLLLLAICSFYGQPVLAQVAPTNSAAISGSVSDSAGKPVVNAKVSLSGPKSTSTQTDAQGLFVFIGVPFGTYQISAAETGLGTATRTVSVEGDINVAIQYEPASTNELKVIATVSTSANANFNVTPASVTRINPIQAAFNGQTSWRTIVDKIPGVSLSVSSGGIALGSYSLSPLTPVKVSIDGALPYETAVLFDDMPILSSSWGSALGAGTNLGMYPLNAFASADVVRGPGANAPSIVDSIGGSLLLKAAGPVQKDHYELSLSTDPYGGIVANSLAGVRWNKLSATMTYGVNDSPGPLNSTVVPLESYGGISEVNGHACKCTEITGYLGYPSPNYYSSTGLSGFKEGLLTCCMNESSAWSEHSGSIALNYAVAPAVNASVFYSGSSADEPIPYPDYVVDFTPPAGYTGSIPGGQYLLSQGQSSFLGGAPFTQTSNMFEEKIAAQLGHGILRIAALQNRDITSTSGSNPYVTNLQLYGGGSVCSDTSPGCGTGTYVPTTFNGSSYRVTGYGAGLSEYFGDDNRDLSFSYETPLGATFHAGASFVQSHANYLYNLFETLKTDSGTTVYNYTDPNSISETTNEARVFVGMNPSAKTSLDLSTYFVNMDYHVPNPSSPTASSYQTPGADLVWADERYTYAAPRLGFVWRPTASVSLRAAAGGGFAEAPLSDLLGSNGTCLSSATTCSVTETNANLKPEESSGFDVGTDIRLHHNTILSFDVYRTNLYGQVYQSTTFNGIGNCPGNTTAPCYVYEYGNLGASRYEGVLLDVQHDVPHGTYWSFSGGLTRGYVVNVPGGFYNSGAATCNLTTGAGCQNLNVVPGINFNGTFAAAIPYAQGLGTLGYRWNPEKYADLVATYYGNNNSYFQPAFFELDGHLGYPLTKKVSLLLTFMNITGAHDNAILTYGPSIGAPQLGGAAPYGLQGQNYGPRAVIITSVLRL